MQFRPVHKISSCNEIYSTSRDYVHNIMHNIVSRFNRSQFCILPDAALPFAGVAEETSVVGWAGQVRAMGWIGQHVINSS